MLLVIYFTGGSTDAIQSSTECILRGGGKENNQVAQESMDDQQSSVTLEDWQHERENLKKIPTKNRNKEEQDRWIILQKMEKNRKDRERNAVARQDPSVNPLEAARHLNYVQISK